MIGIPPTGASCRVLLRRGGRSAPLQTTALLDEVRKRVAQKRGGDAVEQRLDVR